MEHYFTPLLRRLSGGEWFTSRISAAGLYVAAYPKCNEAQQAELLRLDDLSTLHLVLDFGNANFRGDKACFHSLCKTILPWSEELPRKLLA